MSNKRFVLKVAAGVVAGLILLLAEPWVQRPALFSSPALQAEVSGGPWVPFPLSQTGNVERVWSRQGFSEALIEEAKDGDPWGFAQIVVQNKGSARVESIRFDLGDYPPEAVLIQRTGEPLSRFDQPAEIALGTLEPGQSASIYFWDNHNLSAASYYSDWETFSTAGPVSFSFPSDSTQPGSFSEFVLGLPGWPWTGAGIAAIVLLLVGGATVESFFRERYARRLLADTPFYENERARFAGDPLSFRPTLQSPQ